MSILPDRPLPSLTASPALKGMLWALAAMVMFTVMIVLIRLVSQEMHPFHVAFLRNVAGILFMLPWFLAGGGIGLRPG